MSRSKPGLSVERHRQIGPRLKAIRNELISIGVEVSNAYPKVSRQGVSLRRACDLIDGARSDLENALGRESPSEDCSAVYYGATPFEKSWDGERRPYLHRNVRSDEDAAAVGSLAEIEKEVADLLDFSENLQVRHPSEDDPLWQIAEAIKGITWAVGSLAHHHEELAVQAAGRHAP